jgi:two-component system invasion response regulator UvrY
MIKVVAADPYPLLLRGLREVITSDAGMTCIADALEMPPLLEALAARVPDVLVIDPAIQGAVDRGLLKDVSRWYPSMSILVFSSDATDWAVMQALRNGARGYLLKNAAPEELLEGIKSVAAGRKFISIKPVDEADFKAAKAAAPRRDVALSERETVVLQQLGAGYTISEIAQALGLSMKTVSTYRSRLCRKLEVRNTASLIRYALKTGLV